MCGLVVGAVLALVVPPRHAVPARAVTDRWSIGPAIVTAVVCGALAARFGLTWLTSGLCVVSAGLIVLSRIDVVTKRLPREISYSTLAVAAPLLVAAALERDELRRLATMALGAAIATAMMALVYLASRGGLGDGDVRLAPLIGAPLGWLSPAIVPIGLCFGFLFGSLVGITLLLARRATRSTALPFGPFLAAGAITAMFVGQDVVDLLLA